jgi:hypothetical protein
MPGASAHHSDSARLLRSAWARELAGIVGDDLDDVRRCTALLSRIEQHLIS